MKRLKYSFVLGLITSTFFTLYIFFKNSNIKLDIIIVVAIFIFIFMTLMSYFKMFSKIDNEQTQFQQIDNIIYSGRANHYLNGITVGGNLYLSKNQVIFQTNILNFLQKHECVINVEDIVSIDFEKTLGLVNNSLSIGTKNGLYEKFVVTNRDIWKKKIEEQSKELNLEVTI